MATYQEYKLKDGSKKWRVTGYLGIDYITGKQTNFSKEGFDKRREAKAAFDQAVIDFRNDVQEVKTKTSFKDVYDLWFPVYQTTVRESTWITTKSRVTKYILPKFGPMLFERIDVKTAQKVVNEWAKEFGMYTSLLSYVKRIGDHAVAMEIIKTNPFRQIVNPSQLTKKHISKNDRRKKTKVLKFYTKGQLTTFLNQTKIKADSLTDKQKVQKYYAQLDYALFRLLAYSGFRIGEALALTWEDIDFDENMIDINKTLSKVEDGGYVIEDPKNDASYRKISMDILTMQILKKWKLVQNELLLKYGLTKNEYVFTDIKTNWMHREDTYQRSRRLAEAIGLPNIGNHGFRHTHATMLFEAGVNPKVIQQRLGHSSLSITMDTYTHLTKDNTIQAVEMLVEHLSN